MLNRRTALLIKIQNLSEQFASSRERQTDTVPDDHNAIKMNVYMYKKAQQGIGKQTRPLGSGVL